MKSSDFLNQQHGESGDGLGAVRGASIAIPIGTILWALIIFGCMKACAEDLPDAPTPTVSESIPHSEHFAVVTKKVKRFSDDRTNRWLLRIDLGVRQNDAFTTWMDRPSHCSGCYERNLPQGMADSLPAMIVYGAVVHQAVKFGAERVWGDGQSRKRRWIARGIVLGDIGYDGYEGFGNYRLARYWK